MTHEQTMKALRSKYGAGVIFGWRHYTLDSTHQTITLFYAWKSEVIVGIGSSYEDLL